MIDQVKPKERMTLLKIRDFSQVFSDTFKFIKLNGKSLMLSILIYGGIFSLLLGITSGFFMTKYFDLLGGLDGSDPFDNFSYETMIYYGGMFLVSIVVSVLAFTLVTGLNYKSVIEYEKMPVGEELTMNSIWNSTKKDFGRIMGGMFLLFLTFAIAIFIVVGVFALMAGALSLINDGLMVLPAILAIIVLLVGMAYLYTCFTPFWMIYLRERLGFFDSIKRSFQLIKGNFWSTFLVLLVLLILIYVVSLFFNVPIYVYMMIKMILGIDHDNPNPADMFNFDEFILGLLSAVAIFGRYLLMSVLLVAQAIIYYNLVERNEGEGISGRIDKMGVDLSKY